MIMPVWLYLRGVYLVALTASRPTYLFGHAYTTGEWFYFPALLLLKSAIGFLVLLRVAAFGKVSKKSARTGGYCGSRGDFSQSFVWQANRTSASAISVCRWCC